MSMSMDRWLILAVMTGHRVCGRGRDKRAGACEVDQDGHWGHGAWDGVGRDACTRHDTAFLSLPLGKRRAGDVCWACSRRLHCGTTSLPWGGRSRCVCRKLTRGLAYEYKRCPLLILVLLLTILLTRFHPPQSPALHALHILHPVPRTIHVRTATRDAHQGRRSDGRSDGRRLV
jgi:hypothetical protein